MEIMNGIVFRKAVREDCPQIFDLITELTVFLDTIDELKIDVKELEKDGFDEEHPFYNCLVAEDPHEKTEHGRGKLVGYAVYFFIHRTWEGRKMKLQDLYVTEKYRSKKIGSTLFNLINKIGIERGCKAIEWSVADRNTEARMFYHRKGASDITETRHHILTYQLTGEAMRELHQKSSHQKPTDMTTS